MATSPIRENSSVEEVLECLDALDNPSIIYDSSVPEIEDDKVGVVFPENSVRIEDNSGLLYRMKNASLRVSEVDCHEYVREQ